MGTDEQSLPPAGWYPDPDGEAGRLRYWDGARWTEHRHGGAAGAGGGAVAPATAVAPARAAPGAPRFTALRVIATVYLVLGVLVAVLGGLGVVFAAIDQSDNPTRFDSAEPAAVAIVGGLYVAFIALTLIAASAFIRLMLSIEESTRHTAATVEALRTGRGPG